jgi:hypothetical protein
MTNEGTFDRVLRVVIGLGVMSLYFVGPKTPWAFLGAILVVTGAVGFCPLYRLVGLSTCRTSLRS